jgi:hypothetical protein
VPESVHVIIWGGSKSAAEGEQALSELRAFPRQIFFTEEYPCSEESARVAGLNPGLFVATVGACATAKEAEELAALLRVIGRALGVPAQPYVREVRDGRRVACPASHVASSADLRGGDGLELREVAYQNQKHTLLLLRRAGKRVDARPVPLQFDTSIRLAVESATPTGVTVVALRPVDVCEWTAPKPLGDMTEMTWMAIPIQGARLGDITMDKTDRRCCLHKGRGLCPEAK